MESKGSGRKTTTILLTIIIILIILIGAIFSTLYFLTDTFKTKKEILAKNLTQFIGEEGIADNSLNTYFEKKKNMPYENKGQFYANVDTPGTTNAKSNSLKIAFEGKNDVKQERVEQNIEIQYSDDVIFPLNYVRDEDILGLQTDYVSKKYIAIENNNLKQFATKMGTTDVSQIPDKIEFPNQSKIGFTGEEKKQINEKYSKILEKITDDQITNIKIQNKSESTIILTSTQIKEMLIEFLTIFKDDEIILNKINELLPEDFQLEKSKIEDKIAQLKDEEIEESEVKITITTEQNQLAQIKIEEQNMLMEFAKMQQENNVTYSINLTDTKESQEASISFTASFTGLQTEQVTEEYELILQTTGEKTESYKYSIENTISFVDKVSTTSMTQDTAIVLNDFEKEQIEVFMQSVENRISEVNADQMEECGLKPEETPLANVFLVPILSKMIQTQAQETIDTSSMTEVDISVFNEKFLRYEGKIKGTMLKDMLQEVKSNNTSSEYVKIEGAITEKSEISEIGSNLKYDISFDYDDTGRISKILVQNIEN